MSPRLPNRRRSSACRAAEHRPLRLGIHTCNLHHLACLALLLGCRCWTITFRSYLTYSFNALMPGSLQAFPALSAATKILVLRLRPLTAFADLSTSCQLPMLLTR